MMRGDALLAAVGTGLAPADSDWTSVSHVVEPDPDNRAVYDELFGLYRELYEATSGIAHRLAVIQRGGSVDSGSSPDDQRR